MIVGLKEVIKSMMPKFVWKSSYRIVPGLRKSEQVGDYFFQVKDNHETVVERIYETSSYDELHPNRKHEDEYAEETLSRLEVEIIHQIVLRRMIYQKVFSPVQIVPLGPPELLNKDELEKAGAEFKRIMSLSLDTAWAILDVDDSLEESEAFWNSSFTGLAKGKQNEILRIAEWFELSVNEKEPIKSFILTWIGFNGLYNLMALIHNKRCKDADKFSYMIKQLVCEPQAANIIKNITNEITALKTYNIESESGRENWSKELNDAMNRPSINNVKRLELITRCIYGVRKQVFHEAPKTEDILDRVKISRAALIPIGTLCLKNIIICNSHDLIGQ